MSHITCSDTTEHLVDSLKRFLSDNSIIMARNTITSMREIQEIEEDSPRIYELLLKTKVTSTGYVEGIQVPCELMVKRL